MSKKPESKTRRASDQTTLTISLPKSLKALIEEAAKNEARSTSNYLVKELHNFIASQPPKLKSSAAKPNQR
jgi:hypothetical protein